MSVSCQYCSKVYSSQSNLNRHLNEIHNTPSNIVGYDQSVYGFKCLEENCNNSFKQNQNLRDHLKTVHKFNMQEEIKEFDGLEEFYLWLNNIPNDEFIQPCGRRKIKDCETEIIYFNCNRSGKPRKIQHSPKRMKKYQGSNKIDYACTSQIKVIVRGEKCTAFYYKTHYGHEIELHHLRIPKDDKAIVAGKLASGVPVSKILDSTRENFNKDVLKGSDLLTRKDVNDFKNSYKIQILEGVGHSEGNKQDFIKNVLFETNKKLHNVSDISDIETLPHVVQTLRKENSLIKNFRNPVNPFEANDNNASKELSNKKIVKQLIFYTTRKKRKPANKLFKKPTTAEASKIRKISLNQTLSISDIFQNDHNYF